MSVVGISYLFIYIFFPHLAVVIERCQWKDGSCKSVPPILTGLDVCVFFPDLLVDIVFFGFIV